jgi:hypothetical protein
VTNISTRIDALEQRLKQLKVKQQRIEARRRSIESRRARREETRRKILVGAIVLAKVERRDYGSHTAGVAQCGTDASGRSGAVWNDPNGSAWPDRFSRIRERVLTNS